MKLRLDHVAVKQKLDLIFLAMTILGLIKSSFFIDGNLSREIVPTTKLN